MVKGLGIGSWAEFQGRTAHKGVAVKGSLKIALICG